MSKRSALNTLYIILLFVLICGQSIPIPGCVPSTNTANGTYNVTVVVDSSVEPGLGDMITLVLNLNLTSDGDAISGDVELTSTQVDAGTPLDTSVTGAVTGTISSLDEPDFSLDLDSFTLSQVPVLFTPPVGEPQIRNYDVTFLLKDGAVTGTEQVIEGTTISSNAVGFSGGSATVTGIDEVPKNNTMTGSWETE